MRDASGRGGSRQRGCRTGVLLLCALAAAPACARDEAPGFDPAWALDPVWDDGRAEVAVYEASRVIYGAPRPFEAIAIVVTEDFDAERLVKADPPYEGRRLLPVLKLNLVREIPTPNYDYRIMTSVFVRRERPEHLVKLTVTSHEWCGNTWKVLRVRDTQAHYAWASYFDAEGDGNQSWRVQPGDLLEDQLPVTLRGLQFREGLELTLRVVPTLGTNRGGPLEWRQARLSVRGLETVATGLGERRAWRVEIRGEGFERTLWFDDEGSHPLLRLSGPEEHWTLRSIERRAYWLRP